MDHFLKFNPWVCSAPIGDILLGWLVLGQRITSLGFVGLAIALISVFTMQYYGNRRK